MGRSLAVAFAILAVGGVALLGALRLSPSLPVPPSDPAELQLGHAVSSNLKGHPAETYSIRLEAGDFLRVVVEQQGIDVVVSLLDPENRELFVTDRRNVDSGPEPVEIVAEASGLHRLRVSTLRPDSSGRYTVRIEERHRAGPRDRVRARATRDFATGEALWQQKILHRAQQSYRKAFGGWKEVGDIRGMAEAQVRLAEAADRLEDLEGARRAYGEAARFYGELNDPEEVRLLIELGKLLRALGEPRAAEAAYLQALRRARGHGDRSREGEALNMLGVLYASEAKPSRALDAYDQALAVWRTLGDRVQEASTLHNLGATYTVLGRLPQALECLEQALRLRRAANDLPGEGATLTAIAWVYSFESRFSEALHLYADALRLRRATGDRSGEAATLDRQGSTLARMGRTNEALKAHRQALEILRQIGERGREGPVLANLGSLFIATGDLLQGEQLLEAALPLLRQTTDRNGEVHALLGLAHAARQRGNLELALARIEEAVALVEALCKEAPGLELRVSYGALRYGYRELWIDLLMELHARHPDAGFGRRALEASERGRVRGLLESLNPGSAAEGGRADVALAELEDRIRKLEDLRFLRLEEGEPSEALAAIERKLSRLLLDRDRMRRAQAAPSVPARQPLLDEVLRLLGPDTLLLEYAVGKERSFLWLLGAEGLETRILPGQAVVEAQIRRARGLLERGSRRSSRPAQSALDALGQTLLGPVADLLGDKRLLIVPAGALHEVPFTALSTGPDGRPLILEHEVVLEPSAFALLLLRRELAHRDPAPGTLALIGDPVFAADDSRLRAAGTTLSLQGAPPSPGRSLPRLKQTQREAEAILRLLPPGARRVVALGFDADREAVLAGLLSGYGVVHFATHAILDPEQPELSSLVLTLVDRAGHPRDGFLRAYEIRELRLSADLVVLSACSTGVGRELRGEGPFGLSRAFLDAGAARVLVSLWDVQDQPTAELMSRFYQGLLVDHLPAAGALRQAQLSMQRETRWAAPYYWAGFVLQGEWR